MNPGQHGSELPGPATWLSVFVCLVVLAAGCDVSGEIPPVDEKTTIEILAELHIARARGDLFGPATYNVRDSIIQAHGIDTASFDYVLDWYGERPDRYSKMYAEVLDQISTKWDTRQPVYRPGLDSIPPLPR
jgi:hypothetical protein